MPLSTGRATARVRGAVFCGGVSLGLAPGKSSGRDSTQRSIAVILSGAGIPNSASARRTSESLIVSAVAAGFLSRFAAIRRLPSLPLPGESAALGVHGPSPLRPRCRWAQSVGSRPAREDRAPPARHAAAPPAQIERELRSRHRAEGFAQIGEHLPASLPPPEPRDRSPHDPNRLLPLHTTARFGFLGLADYGRVNRERCPKPHSATGARPKRAGVLCADRLHGPTLSLCSLRRGDRLSGADDYQGGAVRRV